MMETTQILLIAGGIGLAVLAIIAIRGSFKDDDSFYGGSTTVAGSNAADNGPGHDANDGGGDAGAMAPRVVAMVAAEEGAAETAALAERAPSST